MNTIKNFWHQCNTFEKWWCVIFTIVALIVSVFKDTPILNITTTILGMWTVFLVAKGRIENFYIGSVYVSIHAFISFQYGLYAFTVLYLCFYLPLQYIGWRVWRKNPPLYAFNHEQISIKELFPRGWLAVLICLIIISLIYLQILQIYYQDGNIPWDTVSILFSIVGQLLMTWRFVEQWITWLCINIFNSISWLLLFIPEENNEVVWIFVVMWLLKIINALYGWYNWKKIHKQQSNLVQGEYCLYEPQFTRRY